ncbi:unnamed protein product, partial [Ixodes pacificus]
FILVRSATFYCRIRTLDATSASAERGTVTGVHTLTSTTRSPIEEMWLHACFDSVTNTSDYSGVDWQSCRCSVKLTCNFQRAPCVAMACMNARSAQSPFI